VSTDTGGKFAAGVIDTQFATGVVDTVTPAANLSPVSLTKVANLPPVSTTQAKLVLKFAAGVVKYRWQLPLVSIATGVNCHRCQLPPVSIAAGVIDNK
jgi:hypothetical protein